VLRLYWISIIRFVLWKYIFLANIIIAAIIETLFDRVKSNFIQAKIGIDGENEIGMQIASRILKYGPNGP